MKVIYRNGIFDNNETMKRERWVEGEVVTGISKKEVLRLTKHCGSHVHKWGYYPPMGNKFKDYDEAKNAIADNIKLSTAPAMKARPTMRGIVISHIMSLFQVGMDEAAQYVKMFEDTHENGIELIHTFWEKSKDLDNMGRIVIICKDGLECRDANYRSGMQAFIDEQTLKENHA